MTPLSPIHPIRDVPPGRYMLDEIGMLWPPLVKVPFRLVAAVVVLAPGEPTRRQLGEMAATLPTSADDLGAVAPPAPSIRQECAAEAADREERFREAQRLTTAHPLPPVARRPDPTSRPMARRKKSSHIQGLGAMVDQPDEDDEILAEFQTKLKAQRAKRTKRAPTTSEPKIDGKRVAAAYRAKPSKSAAQPKVPTRRALGPGECARCGIPGFRGCEHFLPYLGDRP